MAPFAEGEEYYGDPEEVNSYYAQMKHFLQGPKRRVLNLMDSFTSDKSPERKEWLTHIYQGKHAHCGFCKGDPGYKRRRLLRKNKEAERLPEYLEIGHGPNDELKPDTILWFHNGKLHTSTEYQSHSRWEEFQSREWSGTFASGRIELGSEIGSCSFERQTDPRKQLKVMDDLISAFPSIKFIVYKSYADPHVYPNPEQLQSFYERISREEKLGYKRHGIIKTAASAASPTVDTVDEGRNETYNELLADSDRYLTDAYYVIISLRETVDGFSVACHVNAGQLGTTSYAQYWHYNKDEYNLAKKTFEDAKTTAKNIRINSEYERLPFSLLLPMFRHETRKIDIEHVEVPQIPHIIYGLDVVQEKDWRQTLYGKRYPHNSPQTVGFEVDHSIDEQSRYVTTTPGLGRDKLFKYKYVTAEYIPQPSDKYIGSRRRRYTRTMPQPFKVNPNAIEPIDQIGDQ